MMGSFLTPYLKNIYELRIFDLVEPKYNDVEYIQGSMTNPTDITKALDGIDLFINLTMKNPQGGSETTQGLDDIENNYDLNTKGLHTFLYLAQKKGIKNGVHTSTMSVHYRKRSHYPSEEIVPKDTPSVYGLTKGFGEDICNYFCRWFGMNILALRITGPRNDKDWKKEIKEKKDKNPDGSRLWITHEKDLANAYISALDFIQTGHSRFDSVFIAGDPENTEHNLSKAQHLLKWTPKMNPEDYR